jgi:hypothetical protein
MTAITQNANAIATTRRIGGPESPFGAFECRDLYAELKAIAHEWCVPANHTEALICQSEAINSPRSIGAGKSGADKQAIRAQMEKTCAEYTATREQLILCNLQYCPTWLGEEGGIQLRKRAYKTLLAAGIKPRQMQAHLAAIWGQKKLEAVTLTQDQAKTALAQYESEVQMTNQPSTQAPEKPHWINNDERKRIHFWTSITKALAKYDIVSSEAKHAEALEALQCKKSISETDLDVKTAIDTCLAHFTKKFGEPAPAAGPTPAQTQPAEPHETPATPHDEEPPDNWDEFKKYEAALGDQPPAPTQPKTEQKSELEGLIHETLTVASIALGTATANRNIPKHIILAKQIHDLAQHMTQLSDFWQTPDLVQQLTSKIKVTIDDANLSMNDPQMIRLTTNIMHLLRTGVSTQDEPPQFEATKFYPICHARKEIHLEGFQSQKHAREEVRYQMKNAQRSFAMQRGQDIQSGIDLGHNYSTYRIVPPLPMRGQEAEREAASAAIVGEEPATNNDQTNAAAEARQAIDETLTFRKEIRDNLITETPLPESPRIVIGPFPPPPHRVSIELHPDGSLLYKESRFRVTFYDGAKAEEALELLKEFGKFLDQAKAEEAVKLLQEFDKFLDEDGKPGARTRTQPQPQPQPKPEQAKPAAPAAVPTPAPKPTPTPTPPAEPKKPTTDRTPAQLPPNPTGKPRTEEEARLIHYRKRIVRAQKEYDNKANTYYLGLYWMYGNKIGEHPSIRLRDDDTDRHMWDKIQAITGVDFVNGDLKTAKTEVPFTCVYWQTVKTTSNGHPYNNAIDIEALEPEI